MPARDRRSGSLDRLSMKSGYPHESQSQATPALIHRLGSRDRGRTGYYLSDWRPKTTSAPPWPPTPARGCPRFQGNRADHSQPAADGLLLGTVKSRGAATLWRHGEAGTVPVAGMVTEDHRGRRQECHRARLVGIPQPGGGLPPAVALSGPQRSADPSGAGTAVLGGVGRRRAESVRELLEPG